MSVSNVSYERNFPATNEKVRVRWVSGVLSRDLHKYRSENWLSGVLTTEYVCPASPPQLKGSALNLEFN